MKHVIVPVFLVSWGLGLTACSAPPSGYGVAAASRPVELQAEQAPVNTSKTYLDLIDQMQLKGLWFASIAHIDALEREAGVSPATTLLRADALRQTGQAEASEHAYGRLKGTPLEAQGYRGLGLLAAVRGDYEGAIQKFERARASRPTDALLLGDLGYAYLKAGKVSQARIPIMQAMQLQPEAPRASGNLVLYLLLDGQVERARQAIQRHGLMPEVRDAIFREANQMKPGIGQGVSRAPDEAGPDEGTPLALRTSAWPVASAIAAPRIPSEAPDVSNPSNPTLKDLR